MPQGAVRKAKRRSVGRKKGRRGRVCRYEQLEARQMLAAAIWHNVLHSVDVNGVDGASALDALVVINELSRRIYSDAVTNDLDTEIEDGKRPPFYDVTCDGKASALDALVVINTLSGSSFQPDFAFTVGDVASTLQNRPPNFVTDPVTDAIASAGFEITTVATGNLPAGNADISGFYGPRLVSINAGDQTISVHAGRNDDRFDDLTTISTGEPKPNDSLFDVGQSVDVGLPAFIWNGDSNSVVGLDQADLNEDGILDFVALTYREVNESGSQRILEIVRVLGDGDGGFGSPSVIAVLTHPFSFDARNLLATDLNGDGLVDVIAVERNSRMLYTALGNGDGTFQAHQETVYAKNVSDFRVADIDEDGAVDLVDRTAVLGFGASFELMWMPGAGDGSFAEPISIAPAGGAPNCCYQSKVRPMDVADLNGDGHLDVAIAGDYPRIQIYHSDGEGNFTLAADIDPPGAAFYYDPDWLRIADLTGDGLPRFHY